METVILTIYDETAKQEIFDFLKKFKPQQAEFSCYHAPACVGYAKA